MESTFSDSRVHMTAFLIWLSRISDPGSVLGMRNADPHSGEKLNPDPH